MNLEIQNFNTTKKQNFTAILEKSKACYTQMTDV